ncbi:uncharacterized protein [Dysidea avara]
MAAARVVTEPNDVKYIFINDSAVIGCYTITEDNSTKQEVENSVWFRSLPWHQFDDSKSERVRVFRHTLVFSLVLSSDEGEYYCCTSVGGPCSKPLNVNIFVHPIIEVVSEDYTAFIGSEVNLICAIINKGIPPAKFRWMRVDKYIPEDFITTNDTHTVLMLSNLTQYNSGAYACIADSPLSPVGKLLYLHLQVPPKIILNGPTIAHSGTLVNITCIPLEGRPLPDTYISNPLGDVYENQNISFIATIRYTGYYTCSANISTMTVTENHYLLVYDTDNTTSHLRFLAIIHNNDCHFNYDSELSAILSEHIFELCGCNVNISTERFDCISDARALYNVKLTGFMAGNVKQFLTNGQLGIELVSETVTLYICDPPCEELTDGSHEVDHRITIAIWMASSALIVLFAIIVILLTYKICKYVKFLRNHVPHQETATDNMPNPYANFSRRHQNTVLQHRSDASPPQNNAAMASSEVEQAVEALNKFSRTDNDHPVNCNSQSENQTSRRGGIRDNCRSMNHHQEFTSDFNSTSQASALTCDILSFTENFPLKVDRAYTNSDKTGAQFELCQITTAQSLNVYNVSTKSNHQIDTGKKKESSV